MPDIFVDALSFPTTPPSADSGHEGAAPPAISSSSVALLDKAPRPKQRNCAACRMRRVKCERLDGQQDCVGCVQRGLRCVARPGPTSSWRVCPPRRALTGTMPTTTGVFHTKLSRAASFATGRGSRPSSSSPETLPQARTTLADALVVAGSSTAILETWSMRGP